MTQFIQRIEDNKVKNMVEGIIYRYISPSGKSYIGQTTNERLRRKSWFANKGSYTQKQSKIAKARLKYGIDNFKYEILHCNTYSSKELAVQDLNRLEIYYIGLYDSYKNGYNCTLGGEGVVGVKLTEAQREKLRLKNLGKTMSAESRKKIGDASRYWQNTPEGKAKMSALRKGKPKKKGYKNPAKNTAVLKYTKEGEFIAEFASIKEASNYVRSLAANIVAVCSGRRPSAGGYVWKYKTI